MSAIAEQVQPVVSPVGDADTCWICLMEGTQERALVRPCKCPRNVHSECLARWQLFSSGRSEERFCRFCHEVLPEWKETLLGDDDEELPRETLIAAVVWNNTVYKIPIKPGPEGKAEFKQKVQQLFGFGLGSRFELTFECKVKDDKLSLRGMNAYEAATRCAARSARSTAAQPVRTGGDLPATSPLSDEPAGSSNGSL